MVQRIYVCYDNLVIIWKRKNNKTIVMTEDKEKEPVVHHEQYTSNTKNVLKKNNTSGHTQYNN
jgi:hypothetical protein